MSCLILPIVLGVILGVSSANADRYYSEKKLLKSIVKVNSIECTNLNDVLSIDITENGVNKTIPSCKGFK